MQSHLVASNVVLVAQQFNPSILNQLWLVQHGLATPEDFQSGYLFTDTVVQFQSKDFQFVLTPEQLQMTPLASGENNHAAITRNISTIVDKLPHTPFSAVGLNFIWERFMGTSIEEQTRRLFFRKDNTLFDEFDTPDAKFGAYFSKELLGCRLRVEIKPIAIVDADQRADHLLLSFNFNLELGAVEPEKRGEAVKGLVSRWDAARKESEKIVAAAERGIGNA